MHVSHKFSHSLLYIQCKLQFTMVMLSKYLNDINFLIIINVTHISMFKNYSFNFGRTVTKHGRDLERRRERNIAEPKSELKSFRPSSCIFYGRGRI